MIVEFSVKNFRSIKELQTISFVATDIVSDKEKFPDLDANNIVTKNGRSLLKTVGIYGANASGKSNVVRALEYFCEAIKNQPSPISRLGSLFDPHLYQSSPSRSEPFFQIILFVNKKKYRYGFSIINSISGYGEYISSEWLFTWDGNDWEQLFLRASKKMDKTGLKNADTIPKIPFTHSLFLTHAASYTKGVCYDIWSFFQSNIVSNFSEGLEKFRLLTLRLLVDKEQKNNLLQFLAGFQLNYSDLYVSKNSNSIGRTIPRNEIYFTKSFSNGKEKPIRLNLEHNESEGTKKLFDMAGLLIRAFNTTKFHGGLIILDELDSNFHPSLIIKLIESFNSLKLNKGNVQLLFTSHDTNLLDPSLMRRDQFYFTEKDANEATRLYCLAALKGIQNDANFAKQYLAGFYGGVPMLTDYL